MKKIGFITLALILSAQVASAQKKDLKGPAAKNHKVWKSKNTSTVTLVTTTNRRHSGLKHKNSQKWTDSENATANKVLFIRPPKLTGPKAKNFKPFRRS